MQSVRMEVIPWWTCTNYTHFQLMPIQIGLPAPCSYGHGFCRKLPSTLLYSSPKRKWQTLAHGAERSLKSTIELDRLIDKLRETDNNELRGVVAENIFAFDTNFWVRLANRTEHCDSLDDKKDFEELAFSVMSIVENIVRKTEEKIESSTAVLKSILHPVIEADGEILWPPRDLNNISVMRQRLEQREREGYLDESFLSEVNAQMRKAKEDGDKPGLVAILQKVLQFYAANFLSRRSYAMKDGRIDKTEEFLESIISVDEDMWERLLMEKLTCGGGEIDPEEFYKIINKRVERIILRTENASYQQRVLVEYLTEIERRTKTLVDTSQSR